MVLTVTFRIDFGSYDSVFGYLIPLRSVIGITTATLLQRRMELKGGELTLPVDSTLFHQSLATTIVAAFPAVLAEEMPPKPSA